jgi:3-deoxy-D-manno-octulosonate 8-phosphate phosphatase (KDO 8-P phosphatase)
MAIAKGLAARLQGIRLLVCDVDGVLTDGKIILNALGHEIKQFSVLDGAGFALARLAGLKTAWLSARHSLVVTARAQECGVKFVLQGMHQKQKALEELCRQAEIPLTETAYIGDDLVDLPAFRCVSLAIAVANARPEVKAEAHWVTRAGGGEGAVREVIEKILHAQGLWSRTVETYLARDVAKN